MSDHLSYSSIARFKTCPKQFQFARTIKMPSTAAMTAGNDIHATLAAHLQNRSCALGKWAGPRLYRFLQNQLSNVSCVEKKIEIDLIGQKYIGYVDACAQNQNIVVIVDWKTNKSSFVNEEQLKIYALALARLYPDATFFDCHFYYVMPDFYDRFTYYRDELYEFEAELYDIAQKINSTKEFLPAPGGHCSHCQYVDKCPAARDLQIIPVNSLETAIKIASQIYAAEALVKQAKEKLKTWLIENDTSSLQITETDRFYINNPAPVLKSGKIKKGKNNEEEE